MFKFKIKQVDASLINKPVLKNFNLESFIARDLLKKVLLQLNGIIQIGI